MITLEDRLTAIVALLPASAQPAFHAPFRENEDTDSRLRLAVRTLATAEGYHCLESAELVAAAEKHAHERIAALTKEVEQLKANYKSAELIAAERYGAASPAPLPVTARGDKEHSNLHGLDLAKAANRKPSR
jgi:uncharacterized small protein (DUF1192 family)